jgi:hypothetical protein
MAPVASAALVMIAATAVLGVFWGAPAGAIAWSIRLRLVWAVALAVGGYLAQAVLFEHIRFVAAAAIGLPPLLLSLLTSWQAARYFETWKRYSRIRAGLLALGCGALSGFLCLLTARLHLWAPSYVALAANVCLIALLYRSRASQA